ncbi:MAG: isochorismatase family protein [Chitinivibrionales bacterium]|nr:isochorismatase family protein [Chitinivibrionales bacterium]
MKHPYTLSKEKTGLLVVDVQEKFAPVIPDFDEMVHNIVKLILTFQMFKMPVMVTEQYPKGLGNTLEKIRGQFTFLEVVEKLEMACTDNTHFWAQLNPLELDTIVVCGVETHVCINQTVLGLLQNEYTVHCVADAVGARNEFDHQIGFQKMVHAGAIPTTTEICLFELAQKGGTQSFKYIQKMVKSKLKKSLPSESKKAEPEDITALAQEAESLLAASEEPETAAPSTEKVAEERGTVEVQEDGRVDGAEDEKETPEPASVDSSLGEFESDEKPQDSQTGGSEEASEEVLDSVPEEEVREVSEAKTSENAESAGADENGPEEPEISDSDINDLLGSEDEIK